MASTIAFPTQWGQITITVRSSSTTFDASGAAIQKVIHGEVTDATGISRGRVDILYTYATGVVSTMNGATVLLTATGAQQTKANDAATLDVTVMAAAVSTAAKDIIVV